VTVEGFGLECWAYQEMIREWLWKRSNKTDNAELSLISKARLLRRLDEIQKSPGSLGRSPAVERMHLEELLHIPDTRSDKRCSSDLESVLDYICTSLDGNSSFIDFLKTPSIAKQIRSADTQTEISILRQIVLGWELAARIQNLNRPLPHLSRFTERVLANLIISSLWLKHVRLVLVDQKASVTKALKVAKTTKERLEAEQYSQRGADALRENRFQVAADMYARSINIHQRDADSWGYCSEALMEMGKYEDAENAAYIAAQLQPTWQAMSLLADIMLRQGHGQRAKRACEKAIQLAGDDAHSFCLYDQLADAERKINEATDAIQRETDEDKAHQLLSNFLDEDWDTLGKKVEFTSLVTEQQEQGLLRFAESIRWPYINEVRNQVKQAQTGAFDGGLGSHLSDWLCGLTLPGKWCAAKIMTALITWTPTVRKKVGGAYYEQCGLSLSTCSYWRVRSIMGRVLGCLPGTVSLCGWIGPCPPVKFRSSRSTSETSSSRSTSETIRRVQIQALRLPTPSKPIGFDDDIHAQEIDVSSLLNNLPVSENTPAYVADMMNWSKWVIPDTPVRDHSTYSIKCISLFKAPRKVCYNKKARVAEGPETHQMAAATSSGNRWESQDVKDDNKLKYIAIISFTKDGSEEINCFLFSNPIFVDLPPCRPNTSNGHEVHVRDLNDYQNIWSIDELMKGTRDDFNGNKRVMVINATGNGAETVARAWCAEHGRHAVIRRAAGPCLVCSVRAASKEGLDTRVVIWTD
jgi:tetratricopeptide (TPR) repeat protein